MTEFSQKAFRAIEGKEPLAQLELLREYVDQALNDKLDENDINKVRRRYISIASEVYRGRYVK